VHPISVLLFNYSCRSSEKINLNSTTLPVIEMGSQESKDKSAVVEGRVSPIDSYFPSKIDDNATYMKSDHSNQCLFSFFFSV
jgi:hypothetical protein